MFRFIDRSCLFFLFDIFTDIDAPSLSVDSIRGAVARLIIVFLVSRRQSWQERQDRVLSLFQKETGNVPDNSSYQVQGNIFGTQECNWTHLLGSRGISRGHTSTSRSRKDSGTLLGPKGKQKGKFNTETLMWFLWKVNIETIQSTECSLKYHA